MAGDTRAKSVPGPRHSSRSPASKGVLTARGDPNVRNFAGCVHQSWRPFLTTWDKNVDSLCAQMACALEQRDDNG